MKIKFTYKLTIIGVLLTIFSSCKGSKEINNTKQSNLEIKTDEVIYPLFISFYSIGEGINMNALQEFESFLNEFLQKNRLESIGAEKINWGREGEIDYCFSFLNINKSTYTDFINQTKILLSKKQNVIINEKGTCVHKR